MHAFVPKLGNRCFCWFPSAKFGAHPGGHRRHQHGVSIQISLYPNSVTDVFVGFRPPSLVPIQMGTSMASPYKSL